MGSLLDDAHHPDPDNDVFETPAAAKERAWIKSRQEYAELYDQSLNDPDRFWSEIASTFEWKKRWDSSLPICSYNFNMDKGPIHIKWFEGGETNICYNALDRHVRAGYGGKVAMYWEGNDAGVSQTLTYRDLLTKVCKISNGLKKLGVSKGDAVSIYLPMIPELPATMLACARIGAIHSVIFAGFSAESIADRLFDSRSKVLVTATGLIRGTKVIELKGIVDKALELCAKEVERAKKRGDGDGGGEDKFRNFELQKVLVYEYDRLVSRDKTPWNPDRDVWWRDAVECSPPYCDIVWVDAEHPLFMLYTSGSTGKPKGVLHTTGGYMIGAGSTFKYVFNYTPDKDVFWCTADCGWVTGHTYLAYGPFLNRATVVMYEGVPYYPDPGRYWQIVDKYNVSIFYTAPTGIRGLMRFGDEHPNRCSLKSLRLLGSVGEAINRGPWLWYHEVIGKSQCPIVDTWWQTETGGIMVSPFAGSWPLKPGCATLPFFGVELVVLDEQGREIDGACAGQLAIKRAWPSIARTLVGDHGRFESTYFSQYKGYYVTGDGCRRDKDGYYWFTGRVDDVINVSGHRIGTAEVESALANHDDCSEAAVVAVSHPIKGQGLYAFVTLMEGVSPSQELYKNLMATVRQQIGAFAAPEVIHWAPKGLPKTRSGKIMRRILRKIAAGQLNELGDISTLADPSVVSELIQSRSKL